MGLVAELVVRTYYESQQKRTYTVRATRNVEQQDQIQLARASRSSA